MKKEEKTQLTRERILQAAIKEFGANGYTGASINTICETGISKGLLYHNFKNKDAVYLACIRVCFEKMTEYLGKQDIGSDLQSYMNARFRFFREYENEARIFFETILQPPMHLHEEILELRADFDALNREIYLKVLDTLKLRSGVTKEEALAYFSLMQMMSNGYFNGSACRDMSFADRMRAHEENLSKMLDFMLYGIAERSN